MNDKRLKLLNEVCQAFSLKSYNDCTEISKIDGEKAIGKLKDLKKKILEYYPYDNTLKIRKGMKNGKDAITVLRQLLRHPNHMKRLIPTKRRYFWDKKLKKSFAKNNYRIIS